jgi:hypothetical protein
VAGKRVTLGEEGAWWAERQDVCGGKTDGARPLQLLLVRRGIALLGQTRMHGGSHETGWPQNSCCVISDVHTLDAKNYIHILGN